MKAGLWLGLGRPCGGIGSGGARRRADGRGHGRGRRSTGPAGAGRRARARCRPGNTPTAGRPPAGVQWKVAVPGRGNSSPIVWGDRIFPDHRSRPGPAAVACSRFRARTARSCGKPTFRRTASSTRTRRTATRRRPRPPTANWSTRRSAGTAWWRSTSTARSSWHRKFGDHRQLPRSRRVAGALQGSRVHLPGCQPGAGPTRVCRRLRQEDGQDPVGDAAQRDRGLGHARS